MIMLKNRKRETKYLIISNLVVSGLITLSGIIYLSLSPLKAEISGLIAEILGIIFNLLIVYLPISNIAVFVYLLAKKKKESYLMGILLLAFSVVTIYYDYITPHVTGSTLRYDIAIPSIILFLISLYYYYRKE